MASSRNGHEDDGVDDRSSRFSFLSRQAAGRRTFACGRAVREPQDESSPSSLSMKKEVSLYTSNKEFVDFLPRRIQYTTRSKGVLVESYHCIVDTKINS